METPRLHSRKIQNRAILLGVAITTLYWIVFWVFQFDPHHGLETSLQGLFYNIPFSYIFCILSLELLLSSLTPPIRRNIQANLSFGIIWLLGFAQLYFRLVEGSINISGHMTWLSIMVTQCYLKGCSPGLKLAAIVVWLQAAYYNFYLFPSSAGGLNGVVLGIVLSALLVVLHKVFEARFNIANDGGSKL